MHVFAKYDKYSFREFSCILKMRISNYQKHISLSEIKRKSKNEQTSSKILQLIEFESGSF